MSTAYKVLSTWWRLVLLCGLLVVGASSVLVVPTAQAQEPLPPLSCRIILPPPPPEPPLPLPPEPPPPPEPEPCTVTVRNDTNRVIFVEMNYVHITGEQMLPLINLERGRAMIVDNIARVDHLRIHGARSVGFGHIPTASFQEFTPNIPDAMVTFSVGYDNANDQFTLTRQE